jgi:hypothetical protein
LLTGKRLPDVEGACEYVELAAAEGGKGVAFQVGGLEKCYQVLAVKT